LINGVYIKDLSKLGRDLSQILIIDNTPSCFSLQPKNGIPIKTWINDSKDNELNSVLLWLKKASIEEEVFETVNAMKNFVKM
jgi:carboxy-terminal domain RNA polymerase II polypeptide A small phosphatase